MELDKHTIKKIIGLISFAILLSWGLKNTEFIKSLIALALGLLQPFLIGGVIAFVVNVPMRALENACFIKPYQKRHRQLPSRQAKEQPKHPTKFLSGTAPSDHSA